MHIQCITVERERERVRFLVRTYKHCSFVYVLENFKLYTLIEQDVKILLSRNNRYVSICK